MNNDFGLRKDEFNNNVFDADEIFWNRVLDTAEREGWDGRDD